jgi:glycosyltransferase involved in cell wall biosynthesis
MKQLCIISCPIDTYSGYGARARDFFKALYQVKKDEYDFKILSQRWGSTPWGYIKDNLDDWAWVLPMINNSNELPRKPDIWIQITVPNEFQPIGTYNIGVTAGVETTICDPAWTEGINRMNITLVSSKHAKTVFEQTAFQKRDKATNQLIQDIKLEKPVEVLFEGVDLDKYFFLEDSDLEETDLVQELDQIEEEFCYLFVGHWLQGEIGEDRKNVGLMLKTFLESFKDKKNQPALIMKVSGAGSSIMDRDSILKKIDDVKAQVKGKLPNVYLLHGELDDKDINYLYNHGKVKAMINLTKGEGFGRPLLEFSLTKKPIIVSGWSGQTEFLDRDFTCQLGGELKPTHPSTHVQGIILPDAQWFSPDINQAKHYLKDVYSKYEKYQELAKRQAKKSREEFSFDKMKELVKTYFDKIPKSTQPQLQLPKLKKIELPKLNKV